MPNLLRLFSYLFILMTASQSYAMYAAIYNEPKENIQTNRPTHFLVVTEGQELANLPYEAALTQAKFLKYQHPDDQIIFLSEFTQNNQSLDQLNRWNLEMVFYSRDPYTYFSLLSTPSMIRYMKMFNQIKSFYLYGHGNIPTGARLQHGFRFGANEEEYLYAAQLKNNFAKDAYAVINSCNSGWDMAIRLSKHWGIPVAGSFTGTVFEKIKSSKKILDCANGKCLRQVPQNTVYHGHYGNYQNPSLNFFKFFCSGFDEAKCYTGMATSAVNSVNDFSRKLSDLSSNDYKLMVADLLCRNDENGNKNICISRLKLFDRSVGKDNNLRNSFFMKSKYGQLNASFEGHDAKIECIRSAPGKELDCTIKADINPQADTFIREYEAYIKGFNVIQIKKLK